ncbi:MAG TPA: hypothetical protein EYP62_04230 [Kiritimatiellae bacterium]|nr:hypothetical protein [Kiritimatiellia bacterium]
MRKSLLWALLLIALVVLILIRNSGGSIRLSLILTSVKVSLPLALLAFAAVGVVIGILLR